MKRCVRVQVKGRVTGVGFRISAVHEARRFPNLQGHVRNVDPRTVECVMQGEEAAIGAMLAWLREGPTAARVTDVTVEDLPLREDLGPFGIA